MDEQRIGLVETRIQGNEPGIPAQLVRYQFRNHLGSATLELDDQAQTISYEEYTPYGSTSYQAVRSQTETPKRYRYTGQERDGDWDKDLIFHDLVGSAVTDAQGAFRIEFDEFYFKEIFLDRLPDLFFRVFREDTLLRSTEDSVLWNVPAGETEIIIEVDMVSNGKPESFIVRGQIRHQDGSLLRGVTARAFDKDLRSEELLGEAVTNDVYCRAIQ